MEEDIKVINNLFYNNLNSKNKFTAFKILWSNDINLEKASRYIKGYSNKYKDYTYRIIKLENVDFIKTKKCRFEYGE
jgi:hypothetical protein